jgi:hypothetical protein
MDNGILVEPPADDRFHSLDEKEYGKNTDGVWWVRPPGCLTSGLIDVEVTEHRDGTITMERVLRCYHCGNVGHRLIRGVWQGDQPLRNAMVAEALAAEDEAEA